MKTILLKLIQFYKRKFRCVDCHTEMVIDTDGRNPKCPVCGGPMQGA